MLVWGQRRQTGTLGSPQTPPSSPLRLVSLMNRTHGIPPPHCQIKRSSTGICGAAGHVMERGLGAGGSASSLGVAEKSPPSVRSSTGPWG